MLRLKELRLCTNMTQSEVADKLGIPKASLSQWENGTREMNYNNLRRFAEFYGCTIDYLLGIDTKDIVLKKDEKILVSKYRLLEQDDRLKVQGYLDGLKG